MLERFDREQPPPPTLKAEDPFANRVPERYQRYGWQALATRSLRTELDHELIEDLRPLLDENAPAGDMDAVDERSPTGCLCVVQALQRSLGRSPDIVPIPELQAAARAELLADSARRAASGIGSASGMATLDRE